MMHLDAAMRLATARRLMAQGVTIFRPDTCVIDAEVEVGPDTIIEPFVQLLGDTHIGTDCRIRSYSVIQNSTLGDSVLVRNGCILDERHRRRRRNPRPLRAPAPRKRNRREAHIGNFVETKKVHLGRGSKANHLTYLGDATIGAGTNIGAGTITCNYDGVHKHPTTIGDDVFVGSDSTLVAPSPSATAPTSPPAPASQKMYRPTLALGRSRQTTKDGWVAARKVRKA